MRVVVVVMEGGGVGAVCVSVNLGLVNRSARWIGCMHCSLNHLRFCHLHARASPRTQMTCANTSAVCIDPFSRNTDVCVGLLMPLPISLEYCEGAQGPLGRGQPVIDVAAPAAALSSQ